MWTALAIVLIALLAALVTLVLIARCFRVVRVVGYSMEPTLHDGEQLLMLRNIFQSTLRHEQIVTLDWTAMLDGDIRQIPGVETAKPGVKRLFGLPGDWIWIPADNKEKTTRRTTPGENIPEGFRQLQVPPGHCFLSCDNTAHGSDSRQWGCLPLRAISGVMVAKLNNRTGQQSSTVNPPHYR